MIRPVLFVVAAVLTASAAQAQDWRPRGDSPSDIALRQRLERDRWRAGLDERNAASAAAQRRAEAAIYGLQARRGPAFVPPPGPVVGAEPSPQTQLALDISAAEAQARRLDSERRLQAMNAWLDRTRDRR